MEIEDTDTILIEIPAQLIAQKKEEHYIVHVTKNFEAPYTDKIRALLSTYIMFYRVFDANSICIEFMQTLRTDHNEIYLFLQKIFKSVNEEFGLSQNDRAEIKQLLDGIKEENILCFNAITSIEMYKKILSVHDKFTKQQMNLQVEHNAIVDRFEDVYLKSGLSSYSKDFSELADAEKKAKESWLLLLAASCFIFLIWFLANILIVQLTPTYDLNKIVIFIPISLLAFLILTWVGRRYTMCRQQEITYQHLTTILSIYRAFQDNLDDTNKGLLILETARVVTAIPKPLAKESPSIDYSKIVDIIKIMDKKG